MTRRHDYNKTRLKIGKYSTVYCSKVIQHLQMAKHRLFKNNIGEDDSRRY